MVFFKVDHASVVAIRAISPGPLTHPRGGPVPLGTGARGLPSLAGFPFLRPLL